MRGNRAFKYIALFVLIVAGSVSTAVAGTAAEDLQTGLTTGSTADRHSSHNWAGYTATAKKGTFREIRGRWVQPRISCDKPSAAAAFWIGLGGFRHGESLPLEQTGTEVTCYGKKPIYGSFSEIYPLGGEPAGVEPGPGDLLASRIVVRGDEVKMTLSDLTTGESQTHRYPILEPNTSSADWIAESPGSYCRKALNCMRILPLAKFSRSTFAGAVARLKGGPLRPAGSTSFRHTRIHLRDRPGDRLEEPEKPVTFGSMGEAGTSPLSPSGDAFQVTWKR